MKPTSVDDVPRIVENVAAKADDWKGVSLDDMTELLKQILSNIIDHMEEWNALGQESRGIDPGNPRHGCARADVTISGAATFGSYLNGMIWSLQHCARHDGVPPPPKATRSTANNKNAIVTLWPNSLLDKLEAVGLRGELVLKKAEQMCYEDAAVGGIVGILGAGNIDAPIELLSQMFLKGRVCIFKPNPVNEKQHAIVSKILAPLVKRGYLNFCVGGANVGAALVTNPNLDEIVLTGSSSTYDKIRPMCSTPICAELGGVNPWIVVPGKEWNEKSIDRHARHLAFSKVANNGHTYAAPQIVVVAKDWPWRRQFLDRVRFWLGQYAGAPPFYPGSEETHSYFRILPNAEVIQGKAEDIFDNQQRPILITDVAVDEENQSAVFTRESFCPVLAEVPLDCSNAVDSMAYLRAAIELAKRRCFGSLTANILIPDKEIMANKKEFDDIIADMPFGVVGVNLWPAFAHSMPMLVWGAPPGYSQSGTGFIGNSCLYRDPQKAILRAPFNWLGRRALTVMSPNKSELVFSRLTRYKVRPNAFTQAMLFTALFVGI